MYPQVGAIALPRNLELSARPRRRQSRAVLETPKGRPQPGPNGFSSRMCDGIAIRLRHAQDVFFVEQVDVAGSPCGAQRSTFVESNSMLVLNCVEFVLRDHFEMRRPPLKSALLVPSGRGGLRNRSNTFALLPEVTPLFRCHR